MESASFGVGQTVTDYRFSPYSITNKYYSPLTIWMYSTKGKDGVANPYYTQVALTNLMGATHLAISAASALVLSSLF